MEANPNIVPQTSLGIIVMNRMRLYYLHPEAILKLDDVIEKFVHKPEDHNLLEDLGKILPIEKRNPVSFKQRVEAMFYVSEKLWSVALEKGKKTWGEDFSRDNLLRITKTMPMSHYSYLVGSREPANVLLTRNDILQDPVVAMVKLQHDIESLSDFLRNSQVKA